MELSYDEIRRVHRLEKSSSKLVQLDSDFYSSLSEFIGSEKKEYLASLKDFSGSKARDFSNMRKMVEEIFSMRIKKIMNLSLVALRTGEKDDSNMATQEKKLFLDMISLLKKHNKVIEEVFSEQGSSGKRVLNNLSVKVLSDVPEFVGTDMKEYGPFKAGSVVELPLKIAKLLMEKKLVGESD